MHGQRDRGPALRADLVRVRVMVRVRVRVRARVRVRVRARVRVRVRARVRVRVRAALRADLDHGAPEHVVLLGRPRLACTPALGVALGPFSAPLLVQAPLLATRERSLRRARGTCACTVLRAGRCRRPL